jgi:serine protease Do
VSPAADHGALGLAVESLTPRVAREAGVPDARGVLVRGVDDSGRAAKAGIRPGDVIVEVDRHAVKTVDDLERQVSEHEANSPLLIRVHRDGNSVFIAVT